MPVLIAVPCRPVAGQSVTGSLSGRLVGAESQALGEAEVLVSGPASPQAVRVASDERGAFRFLALPAGSYAVHIRLIGYRPIVYEHVVIGLGQATALGVVTMESAEAVELDAIVVTAVVLPVDVTSAGSGTNLRSAELDPLPLDRSLNSVISLAPEATYQLPDIGFRSEGVNIAGGSVWDNAYFVDGTNVTDPGMGSGGINLPYNFIQEIQVKTGGYEAEYGRAMGGIVNAITPSGGNEFHGQLFTFFTNSALRTTPQYGLIQTHLDAYSQYDVGGSLSGPVIRNRIWFYLAYNPLIDVRSASFPGITPQRDRQTQQRFAGKLTWQPGMTTRIVLTSTGDPIVHNGVAPIRDQGAPTVVLNSDVVLGRLTQGGYASSLHVEHTAGRALFSATASHAAYRDDFGPQTALGASEPRFRDSTGAWSGGYGGSGFTHLGRDAAIASLTLASGPHALKFGGEYESNTLVEAQTEGLGQIGGFLSKSASGKYFYWARGQSSADVAIRVLSTYAQDSWAISEHLRFNMGLRWEGQWWLGPSRSVIQSITTQFAPRVGIVLAPGRRGSQRLFASAGRFYEQVPLDAMGYYFGSGGGTFTRYPHDPRVDASGDSLLGSSTAGVYASVPGLKGEYYDELTAGYERLVGRSVFVQSRVVYRWLGAVIEDSYANDGTPVYGNPGSGLLDSFPQPVHRYVALELSLTNATLARLHFRLSYVLSRNWGNYTGLYAPEGSPPNLSVQFDNRDSLAISSGPLPNDRTHVVKLSGVYRFAFGMTVGMSGWWQSGTPMNEYATNQADDYTAFLQPRGTAGRTPSTWDMNVRLDYALRHRAGPDLMLDVNHIGSPRQAIVYNQLHYADPLDANGHPTGPANPIYHSVLVYQPAMFVRLGMSLRF